MEYVCFLVNLVLMLSIFTFSLNLLLGYAGQFSMATAAFGAAGGYTSAYLSIHYGLTYMPGLLVAAASGFFLGIIICLFAVKLSLEYLVILTVAFSSAVLSSILLIPGLGGVNSLQGIPAMSIFGMKLEDQWQQTPFILLPLAITVLICWRLGESPYGRLLKSVRDDESATLAVGKSPFRCKLMMFAITSAMAAVSGAILGYSSELLSLTYFDAPNQIQIISAMVVGGLGNIFGPLIGSTLVGIFNPLFQRMQIISPNIIGLLQVIIFSTLLILMLRLMPQGLLGEGVSVTRWFRGLTRRGALPQDRAEIGPLPVQPKKAGETSLPAASQLRANERSRPAASPLKEGEDPVVLKIEGLVKHFGGIRAVSGLDLQLKDRHIAALIGPNGAGKTTIFNLITGFLPADKGKVYLRGKDITGWTTNRITRAGMVRTFQDVRLFYRTSILENIMVSFRDVPGENLGALFFQPRRVRKAENEDREKAYEILKFVGLEKKADVLTGELGFGEQKLVSLGRALATEASILLLDEPCSGVDRSQMEPILDAVLELPKIGKTILVVEHNLDVVSVLASHVFFLEQGRLTAEGTIHELTSQKRLAEAYFGIMESSKVL
ncbi:MAG: branched-chain amino acid ABC transporter ATP-binding protein/permease [Syntrophobacteraceae bacterium]